jgi:hypothetical protein
VFFAFFAVKILLELHDSLEQKQTKVTKRMSEKWGQKNEAAGLPMGGESPSQRDNPAARLGGLRNGVWTGTEILSSSRRRLTVCALPMPMFTMQLYHPHRSCQRENTNFCGFLQVAYH